MNESHMNNTPPPAKRTLLQKRVGALLFAADNITRQTQQVRHMAATENLLINQRARINASANAADEIVNTLLAMAEEMQRDETPAEEPKP